MLNTIAEKLKKYGRIAGEKGYTPGISGNISARIKDKVIITSSGSANGFLENSDFSVVDMDGNFVSGNPKPSSERFLHLEFYKKRPDINSVFHMHSPHLTAFASSGLGLKDKISPEIVYCFDEFPLAEYALPGSNELVENTAKYFDKHDIVLMANHGVITGAKSVKQAYLNIELAEEYAKTIIFTKILGGARILPTEEVEKIYSLK